MKDYMTLVPDDKPPNQECLPQEFVVDDPLHQLFDAVDAIAVQGYDANRRVIYWNQGS